MSAELRLRGPSWDAPCRIGGGVDVLCNNVGIQPPDSYVPAHELSEDQWDRIIDINLKSFFLMTRLCVPEMKKTAAAAPS